MGHVESLCAGRAVDFQEWENLLLAAKQDGVTRQRVSRLDGNDYQDVFTYPRKLLKTDRAGDHGFEPRRGRCERDGTRHHGGCSVFLSSALRRIRFLVCPSFLSLVTGPTFLANPLVLTLSAGIIANRMTADLACGVGPHRRAWIGLGVGAARVSVPAG